MKRKILLTSVLASCILFAACSELASVASQLAGVANLVNCEYSLNGISNINIAGVNLKQVTNGKITAADVIRLTAAIASKSIPLGMDVNVNVKNPTNNNANLTKMLWALDIENKEIATGTKSMSQTIKPKTTSVVPLGVSTDVYSLFSKDTGKALQNFASSFSNDGTSSKLDLRIRPSVNIAGTEIQSPKYITLTKKVSSSKTSSTSKSSTSSKSSSAETVKVPKKS
ncbi:MAG: hypothetical protein IJ620_05375 [Bacteroidales bacterium]|nr:hypothetical protein [Bacteroidales bacterium]